MAKAGPPGPSTHAPLAPAAEDGLERGEVLAQLDRILASGDFDASPRSRDFLRFVVEEALAGHPDSFTQQALATRVFGRREDFDSTIDPIVRIQAGRLRRSLERYYLLAGAHDPIRIELPRGLYTPRIRAAGPEDGAAVAARARPAADGWPTVALAAVVTPAGDPTLSAIADRFTEEASVELASYRDVRVAVRRAGVLPRGSGGRLFDLSLHFVRSAAELVLTARLVDAATGTQVWAHEYAHDGPDGSAAALRETARIVAARVASERGVVAQTLWVEQRDAPAEVPTPYAAVLRADRFFFHRNPVDLPPAVTALRQALATHPECSLAWTLLSRLYAANYAFELTSLDTPLPEALACAQRAVELDPSCLRAAAAHAFALELMGELAASRAEVQRAQAINPRSLVYAESLAWVLVLLGDDEQAPELLRWSIASNPFHLPIAHMAFAFHHLRHGDFEEAYASVLRCRDGGYYLRDLMRASCLGHLGRIEAATADVASLLKQRPDFPERGRELIGRLVKLPDLFARIVDGLARAGLALR